MNGAITRAGPSRTAAPCLLLLSNRRNLSRAAMTKNIQNSNVRDVSVSGRSVLERWSDGESAKDSACVEDCMLSRVLRTARPSARASLTRSKGVCPGRWLEEELVQKNFKRSAKTAFLFCFSGTRICHHRGVLHHRAPCQRGDDNCALQSRTVWERTFRR